MIPNWLTDWIKRMDNDPAESGDQNARDGHEFMDDHQETHAVGTGLALGFTAAVSGEYKLIGAAAALSIYGVRSEIGGSLPRKFFEPKLLDDILAERHYFLASVAIGAAIGMLVRSLTG